VNCGVCGQSGWCWVAALPAAAPVPLRFRVGLWQRAEAGCSPAGSRGISLLWAEIECDPAAAAAASVHAGSHHYAGTEVWFCHCFSRHLPIANKEPTQHEWLIIPGP